MIQEAGERLALSQDRIEELKLASKMVAKGRGASLDIRV